MFFVTKQTLRAAIRETPEGRVYYPTSRAGYLIDAATEDRLARFLTANIFAMIGVSALCASLGSETHHRALSLVLCVAAIVAIRYAGLACVLRNAPRASVPFSHEDAVRRTARTYSAGRIYLMAFVFLVLVPGIAFVFRDDPPWERVAMVAVYVLMAIYACVFCVRVLRAKAAIDAPGGST